MQPLLARDYPEKTIRLIVPYTPGGTADLLARTVGQKMAEPVSEHALRRGKGFCTDYPASHTAEPPGSQSVASGNECEGINRSCEDKAG